MIKIIIILLLCYYVYSNNETWDYVILVQEYPPSICLQYKNCHIPDYVIYFTLHGLWPERNNGTYPSFCQGTKFNYDKLSPILNELTLYWSSFIGNNIKFWNHEWSKHGICFIKNSSIVNNELDYFNLTLNLYKKNNMMIYLHKIKPLYDNIYDINYLHDKLKKFTGYNGIIKCFNNTIFKDIWQCFNKTGQQINCDYLKSNCYKNITIPKWNSNK